MKEVINPLKTGHAASYQRYDWDRDDLVEWCEVPAGAVVLVEGLYSSSEGLQDQFDYKIWVDCPYDIRLARGIQRDGREKQAVGARDWMPAEDRYVAEQHPIARADVVLDGQGTEAVAFRLVRGLKKPS